MTTLKPDTLRCAADDCWLPPDRLYGKPTLYCPRHQRIFGALRTLRDERALDHTLAPYVDWHPSLLPRRR